MKCAKCGNPEVYNEKPPLCRMCFDNAMRDAKILNRELNGKELEE